MTGLPACPLRFFVQRLGSPETPPPFWFAPCRYVLLSIPIFVRRDDFPCAKLAARSHVLLCIGFFARRDDFPCAKFAAHSYVGQVGNLRRVGNPPARSTHNSRERLHCLRLAAMRGRLSGVPSGSGRLLIGQPGALIMPKNSCAPALSGAANPAAGFQHLDAWRRCIEPET